MTRFEKAKASLLNKAEWNVEDYESDKSKRIALRLKEIVNGSPKNSTLKKLMDIILDTVALNDRGIFLWRRENRDGKFTEEEIKIGIIACDAALNAIESIVDDMWRSK